MSQNRRKDRKISERHRAYLVRAIGVAFCFWLEGQTDDEESAEKNSAQTYQSHQTAQDGESSIGGSESSGEEFDLEGVSTDTSWSDSLDSSILITEIRELLSEGENRGVCGSGVNELHPTERRVSTCGGMLGRTATGIRTRQDIGKYRITKAKRSARRAVDYKATQQSEWNLALKMKYRRFDRGVRSFRQKLAPNDADIRKGMEGPTRQGIHDPDLDLAADSIGASIDATGLEIQEIRQNIELLQDGAVGYMSSRKKPGRIRLLFENLNSLGLDTQPLKLDKLNRSILPGLEVDVFVCCETQVDWRMVHVDQHLVRIIRPEGTVKGVAANNQTARPIRRDQVGGTAVMALGRLGDIVKDCGKDATALGRWCYIKLVGHNNIVTYVISAYYPRKSANANAKRTAWYQHSLYYQSIGDFRKPSDIFKEDMVSLISGWRRAGAEVLLGIDANQNVYTGPLADALRKEPMGMSCMILAATGTQAPNSFHRGVEPISTWFGSPGIGVVNAMCYPHYFGVGDHRMFVIEVSSESLFGGKFPEIAPPKSRQLNCKITRTRISRRLKMLLRQHQMYTKLERIFSIPEGDPRYVLEHNKWDAELGELMASAEHQCTRIKRVDESHFSPEINLLIKKKQLYKWLIGWHEGRVPRVAHLLRTASRFGMMDPLAIPKESLEERLYAVKAQIKELREDSPEMRRQYMRQRLRDAKDKEDEQDIAEIKAILKRESDKLVQRRINMAVKPERGKAILKVRLNDPKTTSDEDAVYLTRENEIIQACKHTLSGRFVLGSRAPISHGITKEQLGLLADTKAAKEILDGDYDYTQVSDEATALLLKQISTVYQTLRTKCKVSTLMNLEEYKIYWTKINERTSSSYSGRHYGHYIASCQDDDIASILLASANLAMSRGIPLDRWKRGVTVLLEKEPGNSYIEKLRAICMWEGDFNMELRDSISRKMMDRMREANMIPLEQIATKGRMAIDGVMQKQLFYDQAWLRRTDCLLSSTDAANCYDAVNHPICSLALQRMLLPMAIISTYLRCLQTMTFFLKTGFGISTEGYEGTAETPFMGLSQGSCASPPVWVAVSTMIVLAYRQQGHGVSMNTAWSRAAWIIAAILYVDDTDLLHRRGRQDLTRTDFVQRVNKATYLWALLLQGTGGNLKPVKCYYYLLIFKFVKGQPRLLRLSELEHLPKLYILQPDAADVAIELKDCHVASETLGVYTAPSNMSNDQLDKMLSKAYEWADRVVSSTLMPGEVWKSFTTQIMPSLRYSLVPLLIPPDMLEGSFMKFYTVFLPKLKVNRHIREDWKWLPWKYQGLGLPNMGIEKLGESLSYLLRHWGSATGVGLQLRDTYELVQLELGLEGNFLVRNYNDFHSLVSLSWFKTLWQYLYHYKVKVYMCDVEIPVYRERDVVFMEIVVSQLDRSVWESINRVRRFKKVYFLSQLLSGDGASVLPNMLTEEEGWENMMDFPREEPTKTDFKVWRMAIKSITSSTLTWQLRLGGALRRPYDRLIWITSSAQMDDLYSYDQISGEWKEYDLDSSKRVTRRGRHWSGGRVAVDPHIMRPFFVTVSFEDKELCSHTAVRQSLDRSDISGLTVKEILDTLPNQSLWKDLEIGDGEWIREGIGRGSIVIVHDGSYMDELAPEVCSTAVVFFCKATGRLGHVTIAEMTDYKTASNYRGECLGRLLSGLVLEAATSDKEDKDTLPTITIGCDNMGVVMHGNDLGRRLPEKQSQADVLRAMKTVFKQTKEKNCV